jgi:hypothetical protein
MSALEKVTVELQKATGARCVPQSIETDRSAEALYKDSMLRNLPDKLRKNYINQSGKAEKIDSFLSRLHAGESRSDPMPLKKRDEEEIDEALYDFLPGSGSFDRPLGLERLTANQENRFRAMLSEHILQTANSRRVTENSQEFPVCSQFLRDTTEAHLSVNSVLIPQMLNPRIPTHSVSRGRPFLNEMRKLKGVTDAQIFMTSRIATQSIASVFSDFVFQEGLFSLTTAEMNAGNFSKASLGDKGLLPADLQFDENVFMKENGNLVIRVHAAQKNIKEWKDKNVNETLLRTDESSSSFMAELNFEIDREGEMLEDLSIKIGFERTIVVQSAS